MSGTFITFEGPEGAGKSTQIDRLASTFRSVGVSPLVTREPGGTPGGEAVRAVLLDPSTQWSPLAEALLMNAARDAHLRDVILPALAEEKVVLCDRFLDSTRAYQGGGSGLPDDIISTLERLVCSREPDLTLILDLDEAEGMARAAARGAADRFEQKGSAYHARVAQTFRGLAATGGRYTLINATGTPDQVAERIDTIIRQRFPDLLPDRP